MHHVLLQIGDIAGMLNTITSKGPVFTVLVGIIIYFYKRQASLEAAHAQLTAKYEQYMSEDRKELITALNNNTAAFEEWREYVVKNLK